MKFKRISILFPLITVTLLVLSMTNQTYATSPTTSALERRAERLARTQQSSNAISKRPTAGQRRVRSSSQQSSARSQSARSRSSSSVASVSNATLLKDVFLLVNIERTKNGLPAYTYNKTLEKSAMDYAAIMNGKECFSHDTCGSSLKERMNRSGYVQQEGSYAYGENIAEGQKNAVEVMRDWMDSPSHRAAILSKTFKEIGVGHSGTYWVQHFGKIDN